MQHGIGKFYRRFVRVSSNGRFAITPRVAAVLLAGTILAIGGVATATADTLHVPSDFAQIQNAVDAASAGDTIVVAPGTYIGATITKPVMIFGSSDPAHPSVIDDGPPALATRKAAFVLASGSDGTVISGFTIEGSISKALLIGVYAASSSYSRLFLTELVMTSVWRGIELHNVDNSLVARNTITPLWPGIGILLVDSSLNTLQGNSIRGAKGLIGIGLMSFESTSAFNDVLANDLRQLTALIQVDLDVITDNDGNSPFDHLYELPHHNTFQNNDYGPVSSDSTMPYYGGVWALGTDNAFIKETFWGDETYPYVGIDASPSVPSVVLGEYAYTYTDPDGILHTVTAQSARNQIVALRNGLKPNGFDVCNQVWDATGLNTPYIAGYSRCSASGH